MRKIYDGFTFLNEFSLLKIRCEELKDLDVTHVLVEGRYTFTGKEKPLYFQERKTEFKKYNIQHIVLEERSISDSPWEQEALQRNTILRGLQDADDNDIVIISDVDEIPLKSAVESYKPEMGLTALQMDIYWYKFNCLAEKGTWVVPRILTVGELRKSTPDEIRRSGYPSMIEGSGYHFSYLGDEDFIVNKIKSFSHTEFDIPQLTDKELIRSKIKNGHSLWGESNFTFVPIDEKFPSYIVNNQSEFKHLIKEL